MNWQEAIDAAHPFQSSNGVARVTINREQRRQACQRGPTVGAGMIILHQDGSYMVENMYTDEMRQDLSEDQVEPALADLDIANSTWYR